MGVQVVERLVVGSCRVMSLYCYSILRLDPYVGCGHGCAYCFTRFLPGYNPMPRPVAGFARRLASAFRGLRGTPVLSMPFRLSALTDPFQPLERAVRASLGVLRVTRRYGVPVIVSTKSSLVAEPPWLDVIKEHALNHKLVAQFTLITLDEKACRLLEPGTPSPEERLRAIEILADEGVPVVVRVQPLIPFVNDDPEALERLVEQVAAAGARQVIAEYYRFSSWRELRAFFKLLGADEFKALTSRALWERFPESAQKRPKRSYRLPRYELLREIASRRGLLFATCREGLYQLHTAPDCCGIHFMKGYRLRPTLKEYLYGLSGSMYVSRSELSTIPFTGLRRRLLEHYDYLERYVSRLSGGLEE